MAAVSKRQLFDAGERLQIGEEEYRAAPAEAARYPLLAGFRFALFVVAYSCTSGRAGRGVTATDFMASRCTNGCAFPSSCVGLPAVGRPDWRDKGKPKSGGEKRLKHASLRDVRTSYIGKAAGGVKHGLLLFSLMLMVAREPEFGIPPGTVNLNGRDRNEIDLPGGLRGRPCRVAGSDDIACPAQLRRLPIPAEIISYLIWLYFRFPLSLRHDQPATIETLPPQPLPAIMARASLPVPLPASIGCAYLLFRLLPTVRPYSSHGRRLTHWDDR